MTDTQKPARKLRFMIYFYAFFVLLVIAGLLFFYWDPLEWRPEYDEIIYNATIHDGTGAPSYQGTLAIKGDRIAAIWAGAPWLPQHARMHLDAQDADLAPGFIDTHTHVDMSIESGGGEIRCDNFVRQGVTTVIVGNCGRSPIDIAQFASMVGARKANCNIATLIGLNTVRKAVLGEGNVLADGKAIAAMEQTVSLAMKAGALGASTGFEYAPGCFASKEEVVAQLRIVAQFGGIHTTHMRNEGEKIAESLAEVLEISRKANVPLLVSHFKIIGNNNIYQYEKLKALIQRYSAPPFGIPVYVDQYPYLASSTSLNVLLPQWFLAMDGAQRRRVLQSEQELARLRGDIWKAVLATGAKDFSFAQVSSYPQRHEWQGLTIPEIVEKNSPPVPNSIDSQLDVVIEMIMHGGAQMVYHNISPQITEQIALDFACMVGSDSGIRSAFEQGCPHPRGCGTFVKYLRKMVRERGILGLDEAIHRMTQVPANVFQLKARGVLQEGAYADLVLFDAKTVRDCSTYKNPLAPPAGIRYVWVNGQRVFEETVGYDKEERVVQIRPTVNLPGQFLTKSENALPQFAVIHPYTMQKLRSRLENFWKQQPGLH